MFAEKASLDKRLQLTNHLQQRPAIWQYADLLVHDDLDLVVACVAWDLQQMVLYLLHTPIQEDTQSIISA